MSDVICQSGAGTPTIVITDVDMCHVTTDVRSVEGFCGEAEHCEYAIEAPGKSRIHMTSANGFEENKTVFDLYDIGRALRDSVQEYKCQHNSDQKYSKGKDWNSHSRVGCPTIRTFGGGQSRRFRKNNAKQYLRNATRNHAKRQQTSKRQHEQRAKYHTHEGENGLVITESTCPLCSMGIELNKRESECCEEDYDYMALPSHVDVSHAQNSPVWSTSDLVDALPRDSRTFDTLIARVVPLPLSLERSYCTQHVGGPSGSDTLLTAACCQTCGYALDAFASFGGYQACVVTDFVGMDCNHFHCAMYRIGMTESTTTDWQQISAEFAARGWYYYSIQNLA